MQFYRQFAKVLVAESLGATLVELKSGKSYELERVAGRVHMQNHEFLEPCHFIL
jgi:hypothetical protein